MVYIEGTKEGMERNKAEIIIIGRHWNVRRDKAGWKIWEKKVQECYSKNIGSWSKNEDL